MMTTPAGPGLRIPWAEGRSKLAATDWATTSQQQSLKTLPENRGPIIGKHRAPGRRLRLCRRHGRTQCRVFSLYVIDRDDAEYILSTFKGIHEERTLLRGASVAQRILQKFAEMSFAG
jgi:hypothetical protein